MTLAGIEIEVSALAPLNALFSIRVKPSGSEIDVNADAL